MEKYLVFVKAHERLIIVLAVLALTAFSVSRCLAAWDAHDIRTLSISQSKLQQDTQQNTVLNSQLASLQAQVVQLSSQRHATLVKQQAGDATLTTTQAAARLGGTPSADAISLPIDPARALVSQLDELPVLRADLADQQRVVAQQTQVIASLNTTLADQQATCKAQVTALNAKHRRGVWKSIGYGIGAGFIAALLLK